MEQHFYWTSTWNCKKGTVGSSSGHSTSCAWRNHFRGMLSNPTDLRSSILGSKKSTQSLWARNCFKQLTSGSCQCTCAKPAKKGVGEPWAPLAHGTKTIENSLEIKMPTSKSKCRDLEGFRVKQPRSLSRRRRHIKVPKWFSRYVYAENVQHYQLQPIYAHITHIIC